MTDEIETVKVVSNNPAHEQGYIIKNKSDLAEGDVIFGEEANTAPEETQDQFDSMDKAALVEYLTAHGQKPHQATGESKLRIACREVAATEEM